jgi:hypothetical protein
MKNIINALDRARWLFAALVFLLTMYLLNACAAPLPTRRDVVEECAPLPVHVVRSLDNKVENMS